jgi:hypothetical protein
MQYDLVFTVLTLLVYVKKFDSLQLNTNIHGVQFLFAQQKFVTFNFIMKNLLLCMYTENFTEDKKCNLKLSTQH